jgi:hypothetical protein
VRFDAQVTTVYSGAGIRKLWEAQHDLDSRLLQLWTVLRFGPDRLHHRPLHDAHQLLWAKLPRRLTTELRVLAEIVVHLADNLRVDV